MPDVITSEIGARVRGHREKLGLTGEQLAELSLQFVASIELGKQRMTTDGPAKVCKVLGLSVDYIVFGSNRPVLEHDLNSLLSPLKCKINETALRYGQYITERCVFELTPDGLLLTEIAPGVDLQRDVLAQMAFRPIIADNLAIMDQRIFNAGAMGIKTCTR